MWASVVLLALALNLEPNRLGIIGLLLLRPHPIRQLLVFLCTSFLTSAAAGLIVLFVIHRGEVLSGDSAAAIMQIGMGTLALIVATVLFTSVPLPGSRKSPPTLPPDGPSGDPDSVPSTGLALVDNFTKRAGGLLQGKSTKLTVGLGVAISLPSVDYVALLLLISASGESPRVQVAALFTFLVLANGVLLVPIASYVIAQERTLKVLEGLRSWVLARSRRDYAVVLALAGALLVVVGVQRL